MRSWIPISVLSVFVAICVTTEASAQKRQANQAPRFAAPAKPQPRFQTPPRMNTSTLPRQRKYATGDDDRLRNSSAYNYMRDARSATEATKRSRR